MSRRNSSRNQPYNDTGRKAVLAAVRSVVIVILVCSLFSVWLSDKTQSPEKMLTKIVVTLFGLIFIGTYVYLWYRYWHKVKSKTEPPSGGNKTEAAVVATSIDARESATLPKPRKAS